ncbi:MAG: hypothetical protein LUH20_02640 [Lachnospiraceae bacterium]|nr:hypothetical protein [Lachnospiraceae bacterium]
MVPKSGIYKLKVSFSKSLKDFFPEAPGFTGFPALQPECLTTNLTTDPFPELTTGDAGDSFEIRHFGQKKAAGF